MKRRNTHKSSKLDKLIGRTVKIVFCDDEVMVGLFQEGNHNRPYKIINAKYGGGLHFWKSHIKSIEEITL